MRSTTRRAAVNVRALVITAIVGAVICTTIVIVHYVRKNAIAANALAAGNAAYARADWTEATRQYRQYLGKFPDDLAILKKHGQALLMQPLNVDIVLTATGAYARLVQKSREQNIAVDEGAFKRLVALYTAVQNYDAIILACQKQLEKKPGDPKMTITLAQALAQASKSRAPEARDKLQALIKSIEGRKEYAAEYVEACRLLSSLSFASDPAAARTWLDRAVEKCPETPEAWLHRARFLRTARLTTTQPAGLAAASRPAEIRAAARADLERASKLGPADPRVRLVMAEEWLAHDDVDHANAELAAADRTDLEAMREYFIDPDDYVAARFAQGAEVALRNPKVKDKAAPADEILTRLTRGRQRAAALPAAVKLYVAAGRPADAKKCLDEYLEQIKGTQQLPDLRERLGVLAAMVAWSSGKPYQVIESLEPVVSANPSNAAAWKQLAESFSQTDQPARALSAMEHYLNIVPGDADAIRQYAMQYMKQRRWREALAVLPRPGVSAPLELVLLRLEAATYNAVERGGDELPQRLETALTEVSEIRKAHPERADAAMVEAAILLSQRHPETAEAQLKTAIKESNDPLRLELQLARLYAGMKSASDPTQKRMSDAIATAQAACKNHPESMLAWQTLAELQRAAGKPDDARQALESGIKSVKDPSEQRELELGLGTMMIGTGAREAGIDRLKKIAAADHDANGAVRPDGAAVRVRCVLLSVAEVLKDQPTANRLCEEVRKVEGESGLLWRVHQAAVHLAGPDWRSKQQTIIALLSYCLERDPRWTTPAIMLGRLYEDLGRPDRAEEIYRRIVDINPASVDVGDRLLNLLIRQNRVAESQTLLGQLRTGVQALAARRATVAVASGNLAQAVDELKQQVADNPHDINSIILLARTDYQQNKDLGAALKRLDEAAVAAPDKLVIPAARAELLASAGRKDDALRTLDEMVEQKKNAEAHYTRAVALCRINELDRAEQDFKTLSQMQPNGSGYSLLAKFYMDNNRLDQAIAALDTGAKANPSNEELQRESMKALMTRGKTEDVARAEDIRKQLDEARRKANRPEDPELLWVQARVLLAQGGKDAADQAQRILETLLQIEPTHIDAQLNLIELTMRRNDIAGARERVSRALGTNPRDTRLRLAQAQIERAARNFPRTRELASELLTDEPRNFKACSILGSVALAAKDARWQQEALVAVEKCITAIGEAEAASGAIEEMRMLQAALLHATGQSDAAAEKLQAYLSTPRGEHSLRTALAISDIRREQRNFEKAEEAIARANSMEPNTPEVLKARLRLLSAKKDFGGIVRAASEYRAGDGKDPDVLHAAAVLLAKEGGPAFQKDAISLLEYAVKQTPKAEPLHLSLALIRYQSNDIDGAIAEYKKVLDLNPRNAQACNDLAWIYTDSKKDHEGALRLADRALQISPDDSHVRDTHGVILTNMGRHQDARVDFQRAVEVLRGDPDQAPDYARALLQLARCQVKLKQIRQAKASAGQALDVDKRVTVFSDKERTEAIDISKMQVPTS